MSARITDPVQLRELLGIPFTPEQMACITAPPAPQVIVAGAGSGKTTVMAARVVWLVGTGQVAPEQVLGLTFTNKAAGELAERVRKALIRAGVTDPDVIDPDNPPGEPRISTYHAFAGQLLAEHGLRIGLEPTARLLADATRYQLAARVLREAPGPYPALTKSFPSLVSDLLALDAELAEHLVKPARLATYDTGLLTTLAAVKLSNADLRKVPEAAAARLELLELTTRYREAKHSRDLLDFGDQIALSAELALTSEEAGRILRDEFRVVLLDEYQDTSVAQRLLLSGLFGGGTGHAVTAVGDPCQAIYGWRGASVANLDDFPTHFPYADGRPAARFSLSENRRSGGRLLDLANGLAVSLRAMHEGVEALRPAPGAERDGIVRCALLPTHAEEIAWLADSIAHLVRTGKEPGEIAVLCRTAGDFAEIQGALVARDVPVEVVGLSGLLHLPEVADLVAVCEVLQDPGANASLVRILTGPRWRIGPRDLALLGRRARLLVHRAPGADADADPDGRLAEAVEGVDPAEVISLADALDTFLESGGGTDDGLPFSADARVRFARLAAELRDLRRSLADPLMDVLHRVLATTGLEVELSASPHALAARRRETLSNFLDTAAGFAALDGEANLLAFLAFLRTAARYEKGLDNALPGGENTVKVLTAHKSKGLEWDVVAAPGLVTGHFPSEQSRDSWTSQAKVLPHALRGDAKTLPDVGDWDAKGIKAFKDEMKAHQHTEELRLGYVTFTRPRSLLLGSGHWWGPTQKKPRGPSAFLHALYDHCAAGFGEIEAWADEPAESDENPALRESTADQAWPLPLDPTSMARRRRAAETVMSHLAALATAPADPDPELHADFAGPFEAEYETDFDPDPDSDAAPADWDTLLTERPGTPPDNILPKATGTEVSAEKPTEARPGTEPAGECEDKSTPDGDALASRTEGTRTEPSVRTGAAPDGTGPGVRSEFTPDGTGPGIRTEARPDGDGHGVRTEGARTGAAPDGTGPGIRTEFTPDGTGPGIRTEARPDGDGHGVRTEGARTGAAPDGTGPGIRTEFTPDGTGPGIRTEARPDGDGHGVRTEGARTGAAPDGTGPGIRTEFTPDGTGPGIRTEARPDGDGHGVRTEGARTGAAPDDTCPGIRTEAAPDSPEPAPSAASAPPGAEAGPRTEAAPDGAAARAPGSDEHPLDAVHGEDADPQDWGNRPALRPGAVPAPRTHALAERPGAVHQHVQAAPGVDAAPARPHPPHVTDPAGGGTPPLGPLPRKGPDQGPDQGPGSLTSEEARAVASWDRDLDALAGELRRARATTRDVPVPPSLTASQLLRLAADPDGFAHELARPMPRPPQPAARRGTRFHAWVESRFEELPLPMLGPDELPGGDETDADIADERDLAALKEAFERSPYARRTPYRVEAPFHLTLAGRVIRGRIDAVYRDEESGAYEIVDWKTSRTRAADPLQLAVYRLAWAEQYDLPLDSVGAAFLYVRTGEIARPASLPGRAELERILLDEPGPAAG